MKLCQDVNYSHTPVHMHNTNSSLMVITEMSSLSWQFVASLNHVSGLRHSVGVACITDIVDVLLLLSSS